MAMSIFCCHYDPFDICISDLSLIFHLLILFHPSVRKFASSLLEASYALSRRNHIFSCSLVGHMALRVHSVAFTHVIASDHKNAASSKMSRVIIKNYLMPNLNRLIVLCVTGYIHGPRLFLSLMQYLKQRAGLIIAHTMVRT